MPPASPLANLADWFVPLQTVLLYGAPVLFVGWLFVRHRDWSDAQLVRAILAATALYLLLAAVGWYVDRDFARNPLPVVASTTVVILPTLAVIGWVWREGQRRGWNPLLKVCLPIVAGYAVGVALAIPSMIVFVMLGGDTL